MEFEAEVREFLALAQKHGLRVIMIGGAAVDHHGYKRHSADVDLWIEPSGVDQNDLIASKLRSLRPKDLLDVQELKRMRT